MHKILIMLIIGIAGGTGSGKTTLVNRLLQKLDANQVGLLSQDSYYNKTNDLSPEERTTINFDHPDSIDFDLLIQHLKELKAGKTIKQPVYSFVSHNRTNDFLNTAPKNVLIIEGILIFSNEQLRSLLDIKIFVQAEDDIRLLRRIKRDLSERGRTIDEVLTRYQTTLKPMHEKFIAPTKKFADLIVPTDTSNNNTVAEALVLALISQKNHILV